LILKGLRKLKNFRGQLGSFVVAAVDMCATGCHALFTIDRGRQETAVF
jgi:hypothetical protein